MSTALTENGDINTDNAPDFEPEVEALGLRGTAEQPAGNDLKGDQRSISDTGKDQKPTPDTIAIEPEIESLVIEASQAGEHATATDRAEISTSVPAQLNHTTSEDEVDGLIGDTSTDDVADDANGALGTAEETGTDNGDEAGSTADIVRTATPGSRTSTPPPGSTSVVAPKKFSAVNVTKKFLSKTGTPGSTPAVGSKLGGSAGRSSASPVPISTTSRLQSTKLTTAPIAKSSSSPNPVAPGISPTTTSPWAKPVIPAEPTPAMAAATKSSLHQPAPKKALTSMASMNAAPTVVMGSGQGIGAPRQAWKPVQEGRGRMGMARDFPTTREIAEGKMAAQAAAQAQAAHNQALLQSLNAFTHLDPNSERWDEEDDDDILDFGDRPVPPPIEPTTDVPVSKAERFERENFDRTWPRRAPEASDRVLFNASSNRLEPSLPRNNQHGSGTNQVVPTRLMSRPTDAPTVRNVDDRQNQPPPRQFATDREREAGKVERQVPPHLQAGGRQLPPHMTAPPPSASSGPSAAGTDPSRAPISSTTAGGRQAWGVQQNQQQQSQPQMPSDRGHQPDQRRSSMDWREPSSSPKTLRQNIPLPHQQPPSHLSQPPPPHSQAQHPPYPARGPPPQHSPQDAPQGGPAASAAGGASQVVSPGVDSQAAEMHTAAERARLRRLAEEEERNAAAERARRKAKELEERLGLRDASAKDSPTATAPQVAPQQPQSAHGPSPSGPSGVPSLLRRPAPPPGFANGPVAPNQSVSTQAVGQQAPSAVAPTTGTQEPSRLVESSWRARPSVPPSAPSAHPQQPAQSTSTAPPTLPVSGVISPSKILRRTAETYFDQPTHPIERDMREAIGARPEPPVPQPPRPSSPGAGAVSGPGPFEAALLETVVRLPGQQLLPRPEPDRPAEAAERVEDYLVQKPKEKESTFDSMLARIQAAMAEARAPGQLAEGEVKALASASSAPASQPAPAPPPRISIPVFFDVTQPPLPKSPPPAWRTFTLRLPRAGPARPPTSGSPAQPPKAAKGWALSWSPPVPDLGPNQILADLLLPKPLAQRFSRHVDTGPIVSISPRTLQPFVRKPSKRVVTPSAAMRQEVVHPPAAEGVESLLGGGAAYGQKAQHDAAASAPAPGQAQKSQQQQSSTQAQAGPSVHRSTAESAPSSSQADSPWSAPLPSPTKKPRSPIKPAPSKERHRFPDEPVTLLPAAAERVRRVSDGLKPGVRFMVSSELEGDSLLDEVNKMSLETVGEGSGMESSMMDDNGSNVPRTPGSETPRTPPSLSGTSSRNHPSSPSGNGSSAAAGGQAGGWGARAFRRDHVKSVWEQAGADLGGGVAASTSGQGAPGMASSMSNGGAGGSESSVPPPSTSGQNDLSALTLNTPMYASLNTPSPSDPSSHPMGGSTSASASATTSTSGATFYPSSSHFHPSAYSPGYARPSITPGGFGSGLPAAGAGAGAMMGYGYTPADVYSRSAAAAAVGAGIGAGGMNGYIGQGGVWSASPSPFGSGMGTGTGIPPTPAPGYGYPGHNTQSPVQAQGQGGKMDKYAGGGGVGGYAYQQQLLLQQQQSLALAQQQLRQTQGVAANATTSSSGYPSPALPQQQQQAYRQMYPGYAQHQVHHSHSPYGHTMHQHQSGRSFSGSGARFAPHQQQQHQHQVNGGHDSQRYGSEGYYGGVSAQQQQQQQQRQNQAEQGSAIPIPTGPTGSGAEKSGTGSSAAIVPGAAGVGVTSVSGGGGGVSSVAGVGAVGQQIGRSGSGIGHQAAASAAVGVGAQRNVW